MNVAYLLINTASNNPDRIAIISEEKRFSYKSFNQRVNQLAQAIKMGALLTPVNFRFVGEEIEYIVNNSEANFFFFAKEFQETVGSIQQRLHTVKNFVGVDVKKEDFAHDYESFLSLGGSDEPEVEIQESDPCQIMYTSGTTGKPKGAVITHGNVLWNLMNTIVGREGNNWKTKRSCYYSRQCTMESYEYYRRERGSSRGDLINNRASLSHSRIKQPFYYTDSLRGDEHPGEKV